MLKPQITMLILKLCYLSNLRLLLTGLGAGVKLLTLFEGDDPLLVREATKETTSSYY
mgnify:CR=1 FL=1